MNCLGKAVAQNEFLNTSTLSSSHLLHLGTAKGQWLILHVNMIYLLELRDVYNVSTVK
jgi:hypothetical protein